MVATGVIAGVVVTGVIVEVVATGVIAGIVATGVIADGVETGVIAGGVETGVYGGGTKWMLVEIVFRGYRPPHSNYLGVFLRFRRTFTEVIKFGEASTHEFQPNFKLSAFEIRHLCFAQYKIIL